MHIIKKTAVLLLFALILVTAMLVAGCGHESFFHSEMPSPLSGDVIVVGDSFAALAAALEAARQGAAVLVFYDEQNEDSWLWNEGAVAPWESELEAETEEAQAVEGAEEAVRYGLREALAGYGGGRGQGWYFDLLSRQSGTDLAWLVRETDAALIYDPPFRYRPDNFSLPQAYERMTTAALNEGVRFFPNTTVEEIVMRDGERAVAGVRFGTAAETLREAYAPAVIIADGGILGSALMEELAPAVSTAGWRGSQAGRGWQLAQAMSLDLVEANLFAYAPAVEENGGSVKAAWPADSLLIVDDRIVPLSGKTEGAVVMELFDSSTLSGYLLIAEAQLETAQVLNWPRFAGIDSFMAAYQLDLPLLRRWFTQPWGNFYARPVHLAAEYCLGGIAVNNNGEVLQGGEPVTGLYAAGEITGGLHGWSLMPGSALTADLVFGRHVGRTAALNHGAD